MRKKEQPQIILDQVQLHNKESVATADNKTIRMHFKPKNL